MSTLIDIVRAKTMYERYSCSYKRPCLKSEISKIQPIPTSSVKCLRLKTLGI